MPRLITCVDQHSGEEPILDSQAYWVRLPDGSRLRDGSGKLLAFRSRENAIAEAKTVNSFLKENGKDPLAKAVPPEPHEYAKHNTLVAESLKRVKAGGREIPVGHEGKPRTGLSAPAAK